MLAELAIWARPLTEEEMRDASAHLHAKWFNRSLPGYSKTVREAKVPDVQSLQVAAGASIDVAQGGLMRIASVSRDAVLTLAGGGTVEIANGAEVSAVADLAAEPSRHSRTNALRTRTSRKSSSSTCGCERCGRSWKSTGSAHTNTPLRKPSTTPDSSYAGSGAKATIGVCAA